MKKILLSFLLLASFNPLFADYLFNSNNACVKEYWFFQNKVYFVSSSTGLTSSLTVTDIGDDFLSGYDYNATSGRCQKVAPNNALGMDNYDFNYLNAVIGVVVAIIFVLGLL